MNVGAYVFRIAYTTKAVLDTPTLTRKDELTESSKKMIEEIRRKTYKYGDAYMAIVQILTLYE